MNNILITANNIHKVYAQAGASLAILKGIGLEILSGELVAIVGPSGAGKSTLMHILGGLDRPSNGQVFFDGQDVYALSDLKRAALRNQSMGFVFQAYHLIAELTALENVILPKMIKENSRKTSKIEAEGVKLLEQLGLKDRVTHRPSQLSGGEQQRVAIARALINKPKVIFCDEPTGNLDSHSGAMVIESLISLNKTQGTAVILVTHDERIARQTNRTMSIIDGKLEK